MASIKEIGEDRGGDKYLVLNLTDSSQLNLDAFDVECRKLGYVLSSTKHTATSYRSASYSPAHLTEGGWKVTGESSLKFIVFGENMYVFSEFIAHISFLRGLKDRKVDGRLMDAGKITLKDSIVMGEDGKPKIDQTKRYLYGSSASLYAYNEDTYRKDVLEPRLSAVFTFVEPTWGE